MRNAFRFGLMVALIGLMSAALFAAGPRTAPGTEIFVPAGAHAPGQAGTFWQTDVRIFNPGDMRADAHVDVYQLDRDADNSGVTPVSLTVPAGEVMTYEDIYVSLFGHGEEDVLAGGFRFASDVPVIVTSRTYTPADVEDPSKGTYGQYIPGIPVENFLMASTVREMTYTDLLYVDDTAGFRTNLGLIDGCGGSTVTITAYGPDGMMLGTMDVTLQAWEVRQIGNILGVMGLAGMENVRLRIQVTSGCVAVYVSQVDNLSGDPIYVDGTNVIYTEPSNGGNGGNGGGEVNGWYAATQYFYYDYWGDFYPRQSAIELNVQNGAVVDINWDYFLCGTSICYIINNCFRSNADYVRDDYFFFLLDTALTLPADGSQNTYTLQYTEDWGDAGSSQVVTEYNFTGVTGCWQLYTVQTRVGSGDIAAVNGFGWEFIGNFGVCQEPTIFLMDPWQYE